MRGKTKAQLFLSGILLLLFGAALYISNGPRTPAPEESSGRKTGAGRPSGVAPLQNPKGLTHPSASGREPGPRRPLLNPESGKKPGEKGWKVIVVDERTGEPVPFADIFLLDSPSNFFLHSFRPLPGEIKGMNGWEPPEDDVLEKRSTGIGGAAWIHPPDPPTGCAVLAKRGGLLGFLKIPENASPPLKIAISPPPEIQVQVVDPLGRPVPGVPVGMTFLPGPFRFPLFRALTKGPTGTAEFPLQTPSLVYTFLRGEPKVSLLVPMKKPVVKRLGPRAGRGKPVVLELPPTGKVLVEIEGPGGFAPKGDTLVVLNREEEGETGENEDQHMILSLLGRGQLHSAKKGKALFPFVGLGLNLRVFALQDRDSASLGRSGKKRPLIGALLAPGPTLPGETKVFHLLLEPGDQGSFLKGRLLLPSGKPASKCQVLWEGAAREEIVRHPSSSSSFFARSVWTDSKGRFTLDLPKEFPRRNPSQLAFYIPSEHLEASIPLPPFLPPGTTELGDIRLRAQRVLAEGKVQDPQGKPLEGVELNLFPPETQPPGSSPREHFFLSSESGKSGEFRIYGSLSFRKYRLRAWKDGWFQDKEKTIFPGAKNVKIVLRKGGSAAASFLLDKGVSLQGARVFLEKEAESRRRFDPLWKGNHVSWKGLPGGRMTLKVLLPASPFPILEIPGISVEWGKRTSDPRLEKIDLRGKIQVLDRVLGEDGNPLQFYTVGWGRDFKKQITVMGVPFYFPSGEVPRIKVSAPGYRPKVLTLTGIHNEVTLKKE